MAASLRTLAGAALDLLYPPRCVACGRFGVLLCEPCAGQLTVASGAGRCGNCSAAWTGDHFCPRCSHWQALDGCVAACEMTGPARALVHALKYGRVHATAPVIASRMVALREQRTFDLAIATPLHRHRLRSRGFNQAELILRATSWPVGEGMLKLRNTKSQVGLTLKERVENVRDAFGYEGPRLDGRTVAVVDDVVTTGATADACARELKAHGARSVVAVAFARASYLREPAPGA